MRPLFLLAALLLASCTPPIDTPVSSLEEIDGVWRTDDEMLAEDGVTATLIGWLDVHASAEAVVYSWDILREDGDRWSIHWDCMATLPRPGHIEARDCFELWEVDGVVWGETADSFDYRPVEWSGDQTLAVSGRIYFRWTDRPEP